MKTIQNEEVVFYGGTLHPGQKRIVDEICSSNAMYHIVVCPRQFGKSYLGIQLLLYFALNFQNSEILWISPSYQQSTKVYREIVEAVGHSGAILKSNNAELSIQFLTNSKAIFRSAERYDNLRGYSITHMLCDEAAFYKPGVFYNIFRPMLTVTGKKCVLMSTPRGKNYMYDMYMLGKSDNDRYRSYVGSNEENPYANREEIEDARKVLPEAWFRQEYLGEFIEDGGEVFKNLNLCATINSYPRGPEQGRRYFAGIDWARQNDASVCTILDDTGKVVSIVHKKHDTWKNIIIEIVKELNKFKPEVFAESNGIGDPIYEMLKGHYSRVTAFTTTNSSKQDIIENLILAFSDGKLQIPNDKLEPVLHDELGTFTFKYSPQTRRIQYTHPAGLHDDHVISLAIAWECRNARLHGGPGVKFFKL